MTFRSLKFLAPALAMAFVAGAAVPASAAPMQRAALDGNHAQVTLVDHRDGRGRGDRGHDRQWRGRDHDNRSYSRNYYRPYYPAYRAPRYVYAPPPAYYYPPSYYSYDDYYYEYPRTGYFSFSSPNLGLSFGY